jgi:HEXXH motif-containing protein
VPIEDHTASDGFALHCLSWADFGHLARGAGGAGVVLRLRRTERSRRLFLLRALVEETTKAPELFGSLPPSEDAWELLARVQKKAPSALDLILAHPYAGTWTGYTTRLLRNRISGVGSWPHEPGGEPGVNFACRTLEALEAKSSLTCRLV